MEMGNRKQMDGSSIRKTCAQVIGKKTARGLDVYKLECNEGGGGGGYRRSFEKTNSR